MATKDGALKYYLNAVQRSLTVAHACLRNFPSQTVERHNKPEAEVRLQQRLLLSPIVVAKSDTESFNQTSINSLRVSIKIKQADEIGEILCHRDSSPFLCSAVRTSY